MASSDLKSVDWLASSTKQLIAAIDPSIAVYISYLGNSGIQITLTGITEDIIGKLEFLTNTDFNNNILYIDNFYVYIDGNIAPLDIAGMRSIASTLYEQSDIKNFTLGNKTQRPFSRDNINQKNPSSMRTFNNLVNELTSILPYTKSTFGVRKTYQLVLIAGPGNNK